MVYDGSLYYLTKIEEITYLAGNLLTEAGNNLNSARNAITLYNNGVNSINTNGQYTLANRYYAYFRQGQYHNAFNSARANPGQVF